MREPLQVRPASIGIVAAPMPARTVEIRYADATQMRSMSLPTTTRWPVCQGEARGEMPRFTSFETNRGA